MKKERGLFLSIDGGDGVGKSSQIAMLERSLRGEGYPVLTCRDPGTTRLGEAVRKILLKSEGVEISAVSETLLFMAARSQMVEETILPALTDGKVVIADRFLLSTVVYQGYAGGLPPNEIMTVGLIATKKLLPDLTILLDIAPEVGLARIRRPLDRMEKKGLEYHRRVRDGFLAGAHLLSERYSSETLVVDASGTKGEVAEIIRSAVLARLKKTKND